MPKAGAEALEFQPDGLTAFRLDALLRGYYINDQRIRWSGLEATFGAEAALSSWIEKELDSGRLRAGGEFFVNQPFDKNILRDNVRAAYHPNFQVSPFEISRLNLQYKRGALTVKLGKAETSFGRTYFPLFTNSRLDSPFIRTEAILWRETGVFMFYEPGVFVLDMAVVNGSEDRDTNSSKAGIIRLGIKGEKWAFGISGKKQDGIGSESQKTYKNHYGIDFMVRLASFVLSGEAIYDEYGFRRNYSEADIFWPRSLYYRDTFYKDKTPITGIGGYLDLGYRATNWLAGLSYGEYYPRKIGHPYHDTPIKRSIVKLAYNLTSEFQTYGVGLFENDRREEEWKAVTSRLAVLVGAQYRLP